VALPSSAAKPVVGGDRLLEGGSGLECRALHRPAAVPLLVIHGRHGAFVSGAAASRLAAEAPDSRLAWFENSAHFPFLEETELFNGELAKFLAEVVPS
jgi:pimeloyl-ACP methyl ester carboxylesterase